MVERHEVEFALLLATGSLHHRARLKGLYMVHANDWLKALPISSLGQRVQSRTFWIMLHRHLRVSILGLLSKCPLCGHFSDSFDDHVGFCPMGGNKTWRHDAVRIILFSVAYGATLSVEREPKHLLLRGGQKPVNLLI